MTTIVRNQSDYNLTQPLENAVSKGTNIQGEIAVNNKLISRLPCRLNEITDNTILAGHGQNKCGPNLVKKAYDTCA
jgi:hypothetical protein